MLKKQWRGFTLEKIGSCITIYGTLNGELVQNQYWYYTEQYAKKMFREKYNIK